MYTVLRESVTFRVSLRCLMGYKALGLLPAAPSPFPPVPWDLWVSPTHQVTSPHSSVLVLEGSPGPEGEKVNRTPVTLLQLYPRRENGVPERQASGKAPVRQKPSLWGDIGSGEERGPCPLTVLVCKPELRSPFLLLMSSVSKSQSPLPPGDLPWTSKIPSLRQTLLSCSSTPILLFCHD